MFEGFSSFKSRRYWICQTGGMQLWIGLQLSPIAAIEQRNNTREEYKAAVKSFPYTAPDCHCKDCRYFRVLTK